MKSRPLILQCLVYYLGLRSPRFKFRFYKRNENFKCMLYLW